ncbi:MAG: lycopene cyclase domain-containing protein [Patescibacteria group bacterium]
MHLTYLLTVLAFFPVWLILYFHRKDLRQEMIFMGVMIAIGAIFLEAFVWTKDWWQPKTITGTVVGIEDALLGFLLGGIIASVYEEIFKDKLVRIRGKKKDHHVKHFVIVVLLSIFIGNFTFFYLNMHSYYASLLSMLIPTLVIYFYRKDLIILSLATGVIITLISIPVYCISFFLDPTAINYWFYQNISGIMPLGIPIEDLVWFFVTGMFLAPLYEFWKGEKLEKF